MLPQRLPAPEDSGIHTHPVSYPCLTRRGDHPTAIHGLLKSEAMGPCHMHDVFAPHKSDMDVSSAPCHDAGIHPLAKAIPPHPLSHPQVPLAWPRIQFWHGEVSQG